MNGYARNGALGKAALEGLVAGAVTHFVLPDAEVPITNTTMYLPKMVTNGLETVVSGGSATGGSTAFSHPVSGVMALVAGLNSFVGDLVWAKALGVPPGGQLASMPSLVMSFGGHALATGAWLRLAGASKEGSSRLAFIGGLSHVISEGIWDAFPDGESFYGL